VASYGQQQLVLGRKEADGTSLRFAPALEVAQPGPERQQPRVGSIRH
jgi:hypothetical protein